MLALANTEPVMEQLMTYRFQEGSLEGQNFGNLLLAALNGICGSFAEAVRQMGQVLAITGRVLPVTEENIHLQAQFEDGSTVFGESAIFYHKKDTRKQVQPVVLSPEHPRGVPRRALTPLPGRISFSSGPEACIPASSPTFWCRALPRRWRSPGPISSW